MPLGSHQQKREWCCDGVNEIGGCLSGIKWGDFDTTKGMNCFCCKQCGFDYCEKCYIRCVKAKVCSKGHVMVALGGAQDLPNWTCDGCGQKHEGSVDRHCSGLSLVQVWKSHGRFEALKSIILLHPLFVSEVDSTSTERFEFPFCQGCKQCNYNLCDPCNEAGPCVGRWIWWGGSSARSSVVCRERERTPSGWVCS